MIATTKPRAISTLAPADIPSSSGCPILNDARATTGTESPMEATALPSARLMHRRPAPRLLALGPSSSPAVRQTRVPQTACRGMRAQSAHSVLRAPQRPLGLPTGRTSAMFRAFACDHERTAGLEAEHLAQGPSGRGGHVNATGQADASHHQAATIIPKAPTRQVM